ncbi:MAG: DMT family transporter [Allorhizobium sp.]
MIFPALSDHRRGLLVTAFGGFLLSFDIPLVRLGDGTLWSVVALRSLSTFVVAMIAWSLIRRFSNARPPLISGAHGLAAGVFYGLATLGFLGSIYYTEAANTVFIIAFNPMFCALLAWLFLKERPRPATLVTMAVMVAGVAIIAGPGLSSGHFFGDGLAALTALTLAAAITISRASGGALGFSPLVATLVPALIAFAIALPQGFAIADPFWILLDGGVMMPIAFWCLATGPRYLSGAEVGMFYLLETILAPIWLWMIFSEVPGETTLIGGLVLVLALIGHSLWDMRARRARPVYAVTIASTGRRGENGSDGP